MSTKNKVLELLNNNCNRFLSGQQMAEELYVTRAAIWKAIKSLESEGYPIEAVTNRGYRLKREFNIPKKDEIILYLQENYAGLIPDNININVFDEVESTNDSIRTWINDEVCVVIAGSQTKGRGRRGRSFFSPNGTGIYMSVLVHPDIPVSKATALTCIMAVAICRAIKEVTGIDTQIKWVNDIYYKGKKIAGILTEAVTSIEDGSVSYVIMGAGINLYEPVEGFPADIKDVAGALLNSQSDEGLGSRLCGAIIGSFFEIYNNMSEFGYIEEYKRRSLLTGNYVKVLQYGADNEKLCNSYAYVEGIDDECRLLVRYDDGTTEKLSTGEVSVVKY